MKCQAPGCEAEATKVARLWVPDSMRAWMNGVAEFDRYTCDEHRAWAAEEHKLGIVLMERRRKGGG